MLQVWRKYEGTMKEALICGETGYAENGIPATFKIPYRCRVVPEGSKYSGRVEGKSN
jgi:hypothetical protein